MGKRTRTACAPPAAAAAAAAAPRPLKRVRHMADETRRRLANATAEVAHLQHMVTMLGHTLRRVTQERDWYRAQWAGMVHVDEGGDGCQRFVACR